MRNRQFQVFTWWSALGQEDHKHDQRLETVKISESVFKNFVCFLFSFYNLCGATNLEKEK